MLQETLTSSLRDAIQQKIHRSRKSVRVIRPFRHRRPRRRAFHLLRRLAIMKTLVLMQDPLTSLVRKIILRHQRSTIADRDPLFHALNNKNPANGDRRVNYLEKRLLRPKRVSALMPSDLNLYRYSFTQSRTRKATEERVSVSAL